MVTLTLVFLTTRSLFAVAMAEKQITHSAKNHELDNNDNFSPDGRFLCYDTRETVGSGIGNGQTIEMVEIATGKETVIYKPAASVTGEHAAPGVGAVSFSPVEKKVVFIHGPLLEEVDKRGYYDKANRRGAEVVADGSGKLVWVDYRDVETSRPTLPGAHRGGTHRHEYTLDGKRIGFTYDDFLLPQYDRTVGYMEPRADAPGGATHWFAVLVPVVPKEKAKPGELEKASGDSWVGRHGTMRAFIGKVREQDGSYQESLFVVDVPLEVDITTAYAGSATEYPRPPKGTRIRRLTHSWAGGTVRGTAEGDRIAYLGKAPNGTTQVFIIPSDGSDRAEDPSKHPVQATFLEKGVDAAPRWHPSGNSIACISDGGLVVTCVKPGPHFGKSLFLTPHGDGAPRFAFCWSPDGKHIAYNRQTQTVDEAGNRVTNYKGEDFTQIFMVDFPDTDGDGIADDLG